jgi:Protein of unknown function (DUF3108)
LKHLIGLLFILGSCSNWRQKDFKKELDKGSSEEIVTVVTTESDKKMLEKFEVEEVKDDLIIPENKNASISLKDETKKKSPVLQKVKPPLPKKTESMVKKISLPVDYPEDLKLINKKAKSIWELYRANHHTGEKTYLDIHYLGMTVGKIMISNQGKKMINDKEVWHFHARFKSAPFYSKIYELDDTVDTYVTTDQFLSSRYSLVQRETKQDIDDLQLFDRDQLKTFWFYHQKKSDGSIKDKKEEKYIPYFSIDPFSIVFFFQGLPMKNGDVYEIPIINKTKLLILKSHVEGRERIETSKGKRTAIKVHATTKYTGETLKSGDMYFWFSDDHKRTFLKVQAKISLGSVTGDIVE